MKLAKLNDILYRPQPHTLPCSTLGEVNTATSFFSAQFYGFNNLVHLCQKGVKNIWINDLNEKSMKKTAEIYDLNDYIFLDEAFEVDLRISFRSIAKV